MSSNIPYARNRIRAAISIAQSHSIPLENKPGIMLSVLIDALNHMTRSQAFAPDRKKARKVTAEVVSDVLDIKRKYPDLLNREIGEMLDIDGARVSEILNGYRTVEHPSGTPEWFREKLKR